MAASITSVDSDDEFASDDTSVPIAGADFSASGNSVSISDGTFTQAQTITSEGATEIVFATSQGDLPFTKDHTGAALSTGRTLTLTVSDDSANTATQTVDLVPPAGTAVVDVSATPDLTEDSLFDALGPGETTGAGDLIQYQTTSTGGGTVVVYPDGRWQITGGSAQSDEFDARYWLADAGWSPWITVTAADAADAAAPTISSVTVPEDGSEIVVQMDEEVVAGADGAGGWTASLGDLSISSAAIDGVDATIVRLTPSRTIVQGENFTIGYTQPGDGLQDAAGNLVQTLSGQVVGNDSTVYVDETIPEVSSVAVPAAGDEIVVQMSEPVAAGVDGAAGWTCSLPGVTLTAAIDGVDASIVRLTPSRTIAVNEVLTLGYTQPGDGLQDAAGNALQSFADQSVSNGSAYVVPTGATGVTILPPGTLLMPANDRDGIRRSWIGSAEQAWRLQAGEYLDSIYPLKIIQPRPMNEMHAESIWRRFPAGVPIRLPIGVIGGSYPYEAFLREGPPGSTIHGTYTHANRANWGYIECPPLAPGTYQWRVDVYDMELNHRSVSWTMDVDASYGVWLDANTAVLPGDRDGTIERPWKTWDEVYAGIADPLPEDLDSNASAYPGRVCVIRSGTYVPTPPVGSYSLRPNPQLRPRHYYGHPDDGWQNITFDLQNGSLVYNQADSTDVSVSNITMLGSNTSWGNRSAQIAFEQAQAFDRAMLFDLRSLNYTGGSYNNDNDDAIRMWGQVGGAEYNLDNYYWHCMVRNYLCDGMNLGEPSNGGALLITVVGDSLVHGVQSINTPHGRVGSKYFALGHICFRECSNFGGGNTMGSYLWAGKWVSGGINPVVYEHCAMDGGGIQVAWNGTQYAYETIAMRRCTFRGASIQAQNTIDTNWYLDGNVYEGASHPGSFPIGGTGVVYDADNHIQGPAGSLLDDDGHLLDRVTHLGTKGWETGPF